jgi:hypothetical protein
MSTHICQACLAAWTSPKALKPLELCDRCRVADEAIDRVLMHASPDVLDQLDYLRRLRGQTEERIGEWARKARDEGHSWSDIGEALNTTKQGAQQRYGAPREVEQ